MVVTIDDLVTQKVIYLRGRELAAPHLYWE
jgi:hypothetical protein